MIGVDKLGCRCYHPPIPTGRKDRGGDDTLRGHGTDEEASGPVPQNSDERRRKVASRPYTQY